ncbi:type 1 glutamine amidotransferase [Sulfuricaulis sp.]|jgi:GMP synthase-like glutamine amidotransferase|uniref:type 1 glutamine amidotransferase n=1 Tax=Sulfuricaulis sp. TaxID=2003553 RepID=UPI00355A1C93
MQEILIFRHAPHEGPGYLADYLGRHRLPWRLIRIDENDPIPSSIDGVSGLVFMGGPMSVNDPLPWIPRVTQLIQRAVAADVPVLGHCLGGQLISMALGGAVTKNPVKEIGWLPVSRVDSPAAKPWLDGLPAKFEVFHWHGEIFSIPPGATRILASSDCANQAFVIGKTLAFQCHIEMTGAMVREWARLGTDDLAPLCATVQNPQAMTAELDRRVKRLQGVADKFYDRWIQGLR